jgi:hypothetical protein
MGVKVQTMDQPRSLEDGKATGKKEEGIKKETICRAHHETENNLIDARCAGHKDGNTLASIGMPQPKCTPRTYMVIEFYHNSFLFVLTVTDGVGQSQRLRQLPISQHQVTIPRLCTENGHRYDYPILIGLALPITWRSTSLIDNKEDRPLHYSPVVLWTDIETKLLVLGLYIFGKNMNQLSRFLGETVGDVISYYYGNSKAGAYKRWAHCRKAKSK